MHIEYFHASKFGNGVMVAEEFKRQLAGQGVTVSIHHIKDVAARHLPVADLYVFSSPGRFGKPIRGMRRFLARVELPRGTRYAILTTEAAAQPDRQTGRVPSDEEMAKWRRVIPIMNEILQRKGLTRVGEGKVMVTGVKGPLEEGWQHKVEVFAARVLAGAPDQPAR